MHFSIFENKDKKDVIDLFKKVFKKKITEEFWQWRYGIFGEPIAGLLWDENKLVGHYLLSPIPMKINDKVENALLAMSVMIDPDYQGNGVYLGPLAKFTYDYASKKGYHLIFAFPNEKSHKIYFGPLGWNNLGQITEYKKQIKKFQIFNNFSEYTVEQLNFFNNEIDTIWDTYKNNYDVVTPRTSNFLNWRFLKHPKVPYENYLSYDYFPYIIKKNQEPVAYFVVKKFGQEKCHIVDYFGLLNQEVIKIILFTGESICIENNIDFLSFWINSKKNRSKYGMFITTNGYMEENSHCFFGCKQLNQLHLSSEQNENWFVTMADSDVF